jgi:transposase
LEVNTWHRQRQERPVAGYQQLCRMLAESGPGTFGELDTTGARSVLRRYSDAWFSAAARRKAGHVEVRYPRRRRGLMPVRWYHGTFTLTGRTLRLPTARGCPPLQLRLDRAVPYPAATVRSVTLLFADGRLRLDVTAELPIAAYPAGQAPDPARVAGVDLGIIHPFAVAGPDGQALLVSGRAIRAEHRLHLADTKHRRRAVAARAPAKGQRGSRRWRKTRRRARMVEGRHRRHNLRLRQWQLGRTLRILQDKAALAGIDVQLVDERGTSSTCPACRQRIPKPSGRNLSCRHCQFAGHRDLAAAFTIATRTPGGAPTTPTCLSGGVVTHRRAGQHLPGVTAARRDPRRRPPRTAAGSPGRRRPAPPPAEGSRSPTMLGEDPQHHRPQTGERLRKPH